MDQMLSKFQPIALSLFRFITGLLLFQYGVAKIFKFPALALFRQCRRPLIMTAGALELVLGALLMIGLFTRPVAFILSGEMAFAYFLGHMFKNPGARPAFLPAQQRRDRRDPVLLRAVSIWRPRAAAPYSVDAMRKEGEAVATLLAVIPARSERRAMIGRMQLRITECSRAPE